jgi:SulP family sulfate permease
MTLPPGVGFYEVNGPLFFGAAQTAMEAIHASESDTFDVLVFHLGRVPVIDATGFTALESAIEALLRRKKLVILAGPLPRPRSIFEKANLLTRHAGLRMADNLEVALKLADELASARRAAPSSKRNPTQPPSAAPGGE